MPSALETRIRTARARPGHRIPLFRRRRILFASKPSSPRRPNRGTYIYLFLQVAARTNDWALRWPQPDSAGVPYREDVASVKWDKVRCTNTASEATQDETGSGATRIEAENGVESVDWRIDEGPRGFFNQMFDRVLARPLIVQWNAPRLAQMTSSGEFIAEVSANICGIDNRGCGKGGSPCHTGRLLPLGSRIAALIAALIKPSTTPLTPPKLPPLQPTVATRNDDNSECEQLE
ncbi:hypothetical protein DFH08DRAFT_944459 [Mycena albidolilacea]|uniref:Uncharacterized protein n=1 Tax=Mycena albidolilacea TaxID=1033008 RepID=A0AAD6Z5D9_9AGAR|nr:hypothetical protein DFH08DRAFT_944459 [Mycena albidolilacea]